MKKIPPAWNILTKPQYTGRDNAELEPVITFRVVDKDADLINQVKQIELDLLKKLQDVCQANNIKVFAMYGTLLGAVRNGGVIPGDDDIDVALLRPDYDKLMSLQSEFSGKYFLQTPETDNYFCSGYAKLRNIESTAISPTNWFIDCCEGICIDIFPIDNCSKSKRKERWRQRIICFCQRMLYAYTYGHFKNFMDMKMLKWKSYKYLGKLIPRHFILKKFNEALKSGDNDSGEYCCYTHYSSRRIKKGISKKLFESFESVPFENQEILIPKGFDEILRRRYDQYLDYSVYPVLRKNRHAFYVPTTPYTFYKTRFRYCCRPIPAGKKLVLVGDNVMLSEFFGKFGTKYSPCYFVEIEKIEWSIPDIIKSVSVISIDEFAALEKTDYYIVICSIHFRETEKILRAIGCTDYYFFVWKTEWLLLSDPDVIIYEERLKNENQ